MAFLDQKAADEMVRAWDGDLRRSANLELQRQYLNAWRALACPIIDQLQNIAIHAYSKKRMSDGYWHRLRAALLEKELGYDEVTFEDRDGEPPPGTIWIRHRGAVGRRFRLKNKKGRPLTFDEILERLAARGTPYVPGQ